MTRTRLTQRLLVLVGGAALATVGLVGEAPPAQAAACSGTNGVTVVVQSVGGPSSTRCVSGDPGSAMEALRSAGFSVTQPSRFPGAICRIGGFPADDPCINMPPADAYWGFFHGPAGGSWTYSDSGAGSYNPKPGSSVGFRFGSGAAPSVQPAAPTPPEQPEPTTAAPKPTTTAPRPTTAAPKSTGAAPNTSSSTGSGTGTTRATPGSTAPRSGGAGVTPSGSASASASGSASASASASAASPSPSDSPSTGDEATVSAAQDPPDTGSGGNGRLVGGGALLLALATAVGAVALRRRAVAA